MTRLDGVTAPPPVTAISAVTPPGPAAWLRVAVNTSVRVWPAAPSGTSAGAVSSSRGSCGCPPSRVASISTSRMLWRLNLEPVAAANVTWPKAAPPKRPVTVLAATDPISTPSML